MTIIVFAGPSLGRVEALPAGVELRPPAAKGDLYRAAAQGPRAIGLIDGFFEAQPAVWHKEILWALARGIHVFGAASMGALRAAELHPFGMIGVGAIYRGYRRGVLSDDAEVAVQHGPAELGYPSFNEALVNVRATLSRAQAAGVLSRAARRQVLERAASLFYKGRSWPKIIAASGLPAAEAERFSAWLVEGRVDLKRRDARLLIETLSGAGDLLNAPFRAPFAFEHTTFWRALVEQSDAEADETLRSAG